jgi:hypothetical protein
LDAFGIERHLLHDRLLALFVGFDLPGFAAHDRVGPQPHLLHMCLGHPEHRGDHLDREQRGEVGDGVEFVAVDGAEVLVDDGGDHRVPRPDRAGSEQLVQHAAHMAVHRRIQKLQQPDVGGPVRRTAPWPGPHRRPRRTLRDP